DRRRAGRLRAEVQPIVNPYAIVALIAALVALFPVAIVFAFISFSHPRGRLMAMCALLLGVLEMAVGVALLLALTGVVDAHALLHSLPAPLDKLAR
ncbi:MAG: hypothetical protein J2P18_23255, partial [Nocardia sp.]|nr:hypothetical protein [Nocardia sp.]